jgi:hypothetical protein
MCREKRRLKRSKGRAEGGVRRRNRGEEVKEVPREGRRRGEEKV